MRSTDIHKKSGFALPLLAGSVLLGAWLRLINLSGGRFRFPDEFGSIKYYCKYPFLRIVYKPIMWLLGNPFSQEAALYSSAIVGILTILVVFAIGSKLFNETVGSYSAVVFGVFGYHIFFSRTAYAATLQTFFLALAGLLFIMSFKNGKHYRRYFFATGIVLGCAFTTYAVSYAPIAVFYLMLVLVQMRRRIAIRDLFIDIIFASAGMLIPFLFIVFYSQILYDKSYIASLINNQKDTALYTPQSLKLFFFNDISAFGGIRQLWLISIGFLYALIIGIREKNGRLLSLTGFVSGCYLLFSGNALLGLHSVAPRKYLYLIPWICICGGYFLYGLENKSSKYFVLALLAIFVGLSVPKGLTFSQNTFKIRPVTAWLKQQGIRKSQIITRLDLYEPGDTEKACLLPIEHNKSKYQGRVILWKTVKRIYLKKQIRFLITSGIGGDASVGSLDPVFKKNIKPIKTWTIPGHTRIFTMYYLKDLLEACRT